VVIVEWPRRSCAILGCTPDPSNWVAWLCQGLGGILSEVIAYDADGQLLSGSLMDYALPKADEMPAMHITHQHSPSPLNPLGVKGVGEGGAVAPQAAIANAVCDALAAYGVEINRTPIKPESLIAAIEAGRKRRQ
jgi:aerobic carbon-monoxide dehydrogenase large subunit